MIPSSSNTIIDYKNFANVLFKKGRKLQCSDWGKLLNY